MKNIKIKHLKIVIFFLIILFAFKNFTQTISNLPYLKNDSFTIPPEYNNDFSSILFDKPFESLINVINLSLPLEPTQLYSYIKCRKSKKILISTTLCIHDLNQDIHVSGSIWQNGIWESHIVKLYLNYLKENNDWMVFDIGAHIGVYTLLAAKLGKQVISVEPFYDNILRLHKGAKIESLTDRITLISNALSNRRNEIKRLTQENQNIGGQSLMIFKNEKLNELKKDKFLVKTIILDDLVEFIPRKSNGDKFKKAIFKIDIEGFEIYAFQNASKLFDSIDIRIVFMEWGNFPKLIDHYQLVEKMIDFFTKRNYSPSKKELPLKFWEYWTWDIMWIKN
ncbi:unnamed protein product [Brachionus calyciflorus]|uniref:Methyltransferase FkbM domain-containing protein n=1 Tax=Brachionus calyciflorus TaxID=104777 RepID=A0A813Y1T5_9BILA|nr:unnamed protein product [Brachionus calyciflorus]